MNLAILQARMSSTRMPGKVLRPIMGRPMLELQLDRLIRAKKIGRLIVATSDRQDDLPICQLCDQLQIDYFRGNLEDVLDRYYQAAVNYRSQTIIRLTGDCPLADPTVIDKGIDFFDSGSYDYISNTLDRTYPIGLDVEVFPFRLLEMAWKEAALPSEREHVTSYFYNHPKEFSIGQFYNDEDLSNHRWTVDNPEDFKFVNLVYKTLYPDRQNFDTQDILALLKERPELMEINYNIEHGEGYKKSLRKDREFMGSAGNTR